MPIVVRLSNATIPYCRRSVACRRLRKRWIYRERPEQRELAKAHAKRTYRAHREAILAKKRELWPARKAKLILGT